MDLPAYEVDRPHVHSRMDDDTWWMMYFLRQTTTGKRWHTMLKRNHHFRDDLDAKSFIAATMVLDDQHVRYFQAHQPITDDYETFTLQQWEQEYERRRSRKPVLDGILTELRKARSTELWDQLRDALKKHPIPSSPPPEPTSFPPPFSDTGDSTPTTAMSGTSTPRTSMSYYSTPATRRSALSSPGYMTGSWPSGTATPASALGSALSSASHSASPASHRPALSPHFDQAEHARQLHGALSVINWVQQPDLEGPEPSSPDWDNDTLWNETEAGRLSQQYAAGHQNPAVASTGYNYRDYNTHDQDHFDRHPYSRSVSGPGGEVAISEWTYPAPYPPASRDPNQLIDQHLATVSGNPANIRHFVAIAPRLPRHHNTHYNPLQGYYPHYQ